MSFLRWLAFSILGVFALTHCSSKSGTGGPTLTFSGSTTIATFTCVKFSVASSAATTAAATVTLGGLGSGAAYATLASCRAGSRGITTLTIPAGSTSADVYFRTSTAESLTLSAEATGFGKGTLAVTVNLFQVLGQPDPTTVNNYVKGMQYTGNPCVAGGKLFQPDYSNNRVLGWNSIPTSSSTPPDFVLGQPNLSTNTANYGGVSASSMYGPFGCTSVGTRFFVNDYTNHRILAWNTIPSANGTPANYALGQPDLTSNTANNGGVSASSLNHPCHVFSDGTRLFVADTSNHRVLVWNATPTARNTAADFALGQPDLASNTANNGGIGGGTLNNPYSVASDGTHLFVQDYSNRRVLGWTTMPTTNGQAASFALGQPDLVSNTINNGGVSAHSLASGKGVALSGTTLVVADGTNNRVLIWNPLPTTNAQNANHVLGQPDFTSANANQGLSLPTASTMSYPTGVFITGNKLIVAETSNARMLIFNSLSAVTDGQAADLVEGQAGFGVNIINDPGVTASTFNAQQGIFSDGTRLFVGDLNRNRVLVWTTFPTANGAPADLVLGQPDFTSFVQNAARAVSGATLYAPRGIFSNGTRLMVADTGNHRVLVWNAMPTANGQAANFALGQPDLVSNTQNNGGLSATTLSSPRGECSDGTHLFVADTGNNRVLGWNTFPTASGQAADFALGQTDLVSGTANSGGLSASSMSTPVACWTDGTRLVVDDSNNNRVLVWNALPSANGAAASLVLGQPNLTSNTANNGGVSAQSLYAPFDVRGDGTRLFVADYGNNRVLVWSSFPTTTQQAATSVIGQADFTSNAVNAGGVPSASSLRAPIGVAPDFNRIFVSDYLNHRVLIAPLP